MTPQQAALVNKAQRSLRAARLLQEKGFHGYAASRAYYTMFYVAEAFLQAEGLTFSKHSAVIAAFGQHFARPGRVPAEFHRHLIDAEDLRKVADYHTPLHVSEHDAEEQIAWAEKFLELAERLIGPLPPEDD